MQFIDLGAQQKRIKEKIDNNIANVLAHGKYIMGPEVSELEKRLAEYVNAEHAIACSSGTDALLMALMAHGVGPGDAIFTSPFTFIATAEVISILGATPVFVDINSDTFNIDPELLYKAITALKEGKSDQYPLPVGPIGQGLNPKGIISVDLFGLPCDYDQIQAVCKKHDLFLIEDAAQGFGAEYKGRKACSFGDIGCTSFFPAKPLGCYGDGGMCFTNDDNLAQKMRSVRVHGKGTHKYDNVRVGINGRLDTIQAAILHAKFDIFPEEVELRNEVADRYARMLNAGSNVCAPRTPAGFKSVWAQYSVLAENQDARESLMAKLKSNNIPSAIYYPKPLHLQNVYSFLGYKEGAFPVSENSANCIFSLPMYPYLEEADQKNIAMILSE